MARPFSGPTAYRQTTEPLTDGGPLDPPPAPGAEGGQGSPVGAIGRPLMTSALASATVSNRRKKTTVRSVRWQFAVLSEVAVQLARKSFGRWPMIVGSTGRAHMR